MGFVFLLNDHPLAEQAADAATISTRALYFAGPAIFVGCFRFQYKKWERCLAALKSIVIIIIAYEIWNVIGRLGLRELMEGWTGVYFGLEMFVIVLIVFASGILTSRFLPALDQPSLGPRPLSVRLFEYLFIFQIGLSILNIILGYDLMIANYEEMMQNNAATAVLTAPAYVLIITITWMAAMITAVILFTRFGSVMIRNTYFALMIIGVATISYLFLSGKSWELEALVPTEPTDLAFFALGMVSNIGAFLLILTPSARRWINRKPVETSVVEDVVA